MTSRTARWLLAVASLTLACEPLMGADFGDYRRVPADAGTDMSVADANSVADGDVRVTDTSAIPPDSSIDDGSFPPADSSVDDVDAGDIDTVDGDADDVGPSPPRDGGTTGGACTAGQVHLIGPCGNCGLFLQTCNRSGTWGPPSCQQERDCAPGWREQRPCDGNGTSTWTCTPSCTWMPGPCLPSTCMPNQTDSQPCGLCGTQTRSCQVADGGGWQWSPFSSCMNEKACAPTTIAREVCGNCGTRSRVCNDMCTWSAWSDCGGEGTCAPGTMETRNCLLTKQTRTCDDSCNWGPWGLCL